MSVTAPLPDALDGSAGQIVTALRAGRLSVADIRRASHERIALFNDRFHAFSHLAPASDLEALPGGPLHGLTISIKGNIPIAGLPWTEGSAVFGDRIAPSDAAIVRNAREAGAIVLGATTMSEMAMYGVRNPFEPMGLNPFDPARTAGGSSTGAGVASSLGMAMINIGTDSGGSIRNPACHCGGVGFMASPGTLPVAGVPMHVPSFPSLGIIAREVADVALAYEVLAVPSAAPRRASMRLLVPAALIAERCDDETLALFDGALRQLEAAGFIIVPFALPEWDQAQMSAGLISLVECAAVLGRIDPALLSAGLTGRLRAGSQIGAAELSEAHERIARFAEAMTGLLDANDADAIVSPTWPFPAPPIDAPTVVVRGRETPVDPARNCFVRAANAVKGTAITIPMGLYPGAGVPAGLHLMTAAGRDLRLLQAAAAVERSIPRLPPPPPLRVLREASTQAR